MLLEGVVIVLSILLAFAIDAGWDELQGRRAEAEILQNLSARSDGAPTGNRFVIVLNWFDEAHAVLENAGVGS